MLRFATPLLVVVAAGCADRIDAPDAAIEIVNQDALLPGDSVTLDGTGSSDPNAEAELDLRYQWRLVSAPPGSVADFNATDRPTVSLVPDRYGDYEVGLSVNNGVLWSDEALASFTVESCGNEPPSITGIGASPAAPITDDLVQLTATWTDPDVEACAQLEQVDWTWELTALPAGSEAALNDPHVANPSFVTDVPGDYGVQLTVTDPTGRPSEAATLAVTASECGDAAPTVSQVDVLPTDPRPGQLVSLDATVQDQDNSIECDLDQDLDVHSTFVGRPSGSASELAPAAGTTPAFVPDVPGDYVVRTEVSDDTGRRSSTDTTITVGDCGTAAPTIDSVDHGTPTFTGDLIELAVAASDADNDEDCALDQTIAIDTTFVARPAGSAATLVPSVGSTPAFVADVSGDYVVQVRATDDAGLSTTTQHTVTVDACGEATPTVESVGVAPGSPRPGEMVTLTPSVDDADNDPSCDPLDQVLDIDSAFVGRPEGSEATLTPAEGEQPAFVPDVDGDYVVRTTVTDDTGRSSFADTTVTVSDCGLAPPSIDTVTVTPDTTDTPYVGSVVDLLIETSDADDTNDCLPGQGVTLSTAFLAKPVGSEASLAPSDGPTPAFLADASGDYTLRITATDDRGLSSTQDVEITVDTCGEAAPTIAGVADVPEPNTGQPVEITWTASDSDNTSCSLEQDLTIASAIVEAPAGSEAALSPTAGPTVAFTPDTEGTYVIRGTVTDDTGRSTTAEVEVAADVCGDRAPTARIAAITPVEEPAAESISITVEDDVPVGLSAAGSTDPDDGCPFDTLTYSWWFTAVPFDSTVQFNDPSLEAPSFFPDLPGTYEITVEVSDGKYTSQATATVVVDPAVLLHTASGFTVEFVAGGTTLWADPLGVDVDPSGDILVAQHAGDRVTVTDPTSGVTTTLSLGGLLRDIQDVLYNPTTSEVLVTNSDGPGDQDYMVRLDANGQQTLWADFDDPLDAPAGLAHDLDPPGDPRIAVVEEVQDHVELYFADLLDTDEASGSDIHSGGLDEPWGVVTMGDTSWVADWGNDRLRRVNGTDRDLYDFADGPIDVVLVDATDDGSGGETLDTFLVSVPELGAVYAIERCDPPNDDPENNCSAVLLASGLWLPWGLAVETPDTGSGGSVVVTDVEDDALFRISGDFAGLFSP